MVAPGLVLSHLTGRGLPNEHIVGHEHHIVEGFSESLNIVSWFGDVLDGRSGCSKQEPILPGSTVFGLKNLPDSLNGYIEFEFKTALFPRQTTSVAIKKGQ